jgi:lambda family phage tail tape measure protein
MATDKTSLIVEVQPKGINETTAQLNNLKNAGNSAASSNAELAKQIAGFTSVAGLAVNAGMKAASMFVEMGRKSIELAAGFEKARVSWGVLTGDVAKGNEIFQQLQQFAARTPLSFQAVENAARTLSGFGIETENLITTLSKLGDISLGDNQKLQQLALVFGQVKAQGKAMTQDLYQFVNAGVPIFQMLADVTGTTAGEIKELAAQGKIGYEEIAAAIEKATGEGGKFQGMMEKTSETTAGKFSTFLDNVNQRLAKMGEVFLPAVNAALDKMNTLMTKAGETDLIKAFESGKYTGDMKVIVDILGRRVSELEKIVLDDPSTIIFGDDPELERLKRLYDKAQRSLYASGYKPESKVTTGTTGTQAINRPEGSNQAINRPEGSNLGLKAFDFGLLNPFAGAVNGGIHPDYLFTGVPLPMQDIDLERFSELEYASQITEQYADKSQILKEQIDQLNAAFARGDIDAGTYVRALDDMQGQLDELDTQTLQYKQTIEQLKNAFVSIGQQTFVDTFKALGEYFASGADGADNFEQAMIRLMMQITNQLPLMFLSAGLQLIAANNIPLGLALIGMAGISAVGAGALNYTYSQATKNAAGGVYNSPSLSAYSGGVYDKPQVFAFAKGIGIFGEAGPEAILPLKRTSSGELGVKAEASGAVNVVVNNYANAEVKTNIETLADGTRQIIMTIENVVKGMVNSGKLDGVLYRGGLQPIGIRG